MMDISAFSSRDFDVKEWINKTFDSSDSSGKEISVPSYAMKLQVHLQQLNGEMENTSQHLVHSLPRIIRDAEILTEEALVLKEKMDSVRQEIAKVEQDTGQSIKSLERIDQIKMELLSARQALHEADNWTILGTDVEAAFKAKDIDSVASKLVSMQQSLQVLANVSDYQEKRSQLEKLKNRLEEHIRPLLVQSFTERSIESSKKIVQIFIAINRLSELLTFFSQIQKNSLESHWDELLKVETEQGVTECLHNYYDILLLNWQEQIKWCDLVFPDLQVFQILVEVYTATLTNVTPKITNLIEKVVRQLTDPILFITELKYLTKQFADSLKNMVENTHFRGSKTKLLTNLARAVYAPYVMWISKYGLFEEASLHQQSSLFRETQEELKDLIPNLLSMNSKVFDIALLTKKRCFNLTEGANSPGLLKALEYLFSVYLDLYKSVLNEIEKQKDKHEEFGMFQLCLTFLQGLGDVLNNVKQIEKDIAESMLEFYNNSTKKDAHPFLQWHILLLDSTAQIELVQFVKNAKMKEVAFKNISLTLQKLCKQVHQVTFHVIFAPISEQLELVKASVSWQQNSLTTDLPDYSFVPQEYITPIGHYLMTLPQHLEPFLVSENSALTTALSLISSDYDTDQKTEHNSFADIFLDNISSATCKTYCEFIVSIDELSSFACRQIATDIDYLGNVLGDLGFNLSTNLQNVALLLRLSPREYLVKSSGCNVQLVSAIRRMRNIKTE